MHGGGCARLCHACCRLQRAILRTVIPQQLGGGWMLPHDSSPLFPCHILADVKARIPSNAPVLGTIQQNVFDACLCSSYCKCQARHAQVWSFGVRLKDMRVSKREFVHGYTHIIKRAEARRSLSTTLEDLLGGCFDIFDDTLHGERTGQMSKEKFVAYQVRSPFSVVLLAPGARMAQ